MYLFLAVLLYFILSFGIGSVVELSMATKLLLTCSAVGVVAFIRR